jgi:hypothetical protein
LSAFRDSPTTETISAGGLPPWGGRVTYYPRLISASMTSPWRACWPPPASVAPPR